MKKTYLCVLWVLTLCLFAVGATSPCVWARTIDVTFPAESVEKTQNLAGASQNALWDAQLRATVLGAEVEDLLGLPLTETRRVAVQQYLAGSAKNLVSGLTEKIREALPNGAVRVVVQADVNRPLLHSLLQGVGTVYTRSAPVAYSLHMGDASRQNSEVTNEREARAAATLAHLELVGGMVQRADALVRLHLKNEQGRWHATLSSNNSLPLQAVSPSLESVWSAVWGPYFQKVQSQLAGHTALLQVWGWRGTGGVEDLERDMALWSTAVRSARLGDVSLRPEGVVAQWTLDALDVEELRNRLLGYTSSRHLEFTLTP